MLYTQLRKEKEHQAPETPSRTRAPMLSIFGFFLNTYLRLQKKSAKKYATTHTYSQGTVEIPGKNKVYFKPHKKKL
jgi:hypothetical protein